jgi:hypothetical protein
MTISIYDVCVPVFVKTLSNMKAVLEKAKAHALEHKIDESALVNARLYPDMFPLSRQVQIATDIARGCVARLAGNEPAKYEDNETSFDDLIARTTRAISDITSVGPAALEGAATRELTRPVGGKPHTFTGLSYLLQFATPNVYFHTATTYDILRHNGVPLGKSDYIGKLD